VTLIVLPPLACITINISIKHNKVKSRNIFINSMTELPVSQATKGGLERMEKEENCACPGRRALKGQ
jgi:hypothetical protein